jgi:hypothetical protein
MVDGTASAWIDATDGALDRAVRTLRDEIVPAGPSDLSGALIAASSLEPAPDNIFVLTDGLADRYGERGSERSHPPLQRSGKSRTSGAPMNVILLPKEGEPNAAPAYWLLALAKRRRSFCARRG